MEQNFLCKNFCGLEYEKMVILDDEEVDVNFHFGYLGHPWQQKVWIYGKKLIEEFKKADLEGFKLIEEKN